MTILYKAFSGYVTKGNDYETIGDHGNVKRHTYIAVCEKTGKQDEFASLYGAAVFLQMQAYFGGMAGVLDMPLPSWATRWEFRTQ